MGSEVEINAHVVDAFATEALACLQALRFARDMGFHNIVVEGDSKTTNIKVKRGTTNRSEIENYIDVINQIASHFNVCSFHHAG